MAAVPHIEAANEHGILVVRFIEERLFDETLVREVHEQVTAALAQAKTKVVVLDFSRVESLSSSMLGKLILLQRTVAGQKGMLRLCELNSTVRAVFRSTNLDRLFQIDRDRREAIEAAQGAVGK